MWLWTISSLGAPGTLLAEFHIHRIEIPYRAFAERVESVYKFYRLKALITLERVNTTEWSKKIIIVNSKTAIVGFCKLTLYANGLVMSVRFIFGDDWNDRPSRSLFDLWQWCNFCGIEALEFSCIYTRVQPATADLFPVVANTRTKSIQKQITSIDVDKVGSKKP